MTGTLILISRFDDPHADLVKSAAARRGVHLQNLRLGLEHRAYSVRSDSFDVKIFQADEEYSAELLRESDVLFLPFAVNHLPWVASAGNEFKTREWNATVESALLQWWDATGRRWLIGPTAPMLQDRKLYLLRTADRLFGELAIPEAQVGTHFSSFSNRGRLVAKAVNAWQQVNERQYFNTSELSDEHIHRIRANGNIAPVVIQRFIPHVSELRVYCARGALFIVQIDAEGPSPVDFRLLGRHTGTAREVTDKLSPKVCEALMELCRHLSIEYCCFDFIVDQDGGTLHLTDINPTGSWRYLARDFDVDVTDFVLDNAR